MDEMDTILVIIKTIINIVKSINNIRQSIMANIPAVVSIPLPPLNPKYNGKRWPNKQKNPDKYDATIIG